MKLRKIASTASMISVLSFGLAGVASADTVTISGTGQNSSTTVNLDQTNTTTVSNTNSVTVTNTNNQTATSGDITASNNTGIGDVTTGSASNQAVTETTIDFGAGGMGAGGSGGSGGAGGAGGSGGSGGAGGMGAGGSGSVLGVSTGGFGAGVGTLPEVGAKVPMDVSALRALYRPTKPAPALVKSARDLSSLLLALGALMSFLGASGSAWYAHRRRANV